MDLASLEERLGLLLFVRIAVVGYFLLLPALGQSTGSRTSTLASLCGLYLAGSVVAEWWCQRGGAERLALHRALLPVDFLFIVLLTDAGSMPRSSLVFLCSVQLVAATLLASARTGLRVAAWDAAVLFVFQALSLTGPVATFLGYRGPRLDASFVVALLNGGRILMITGAAALFSAVSERELRRSRRYFSTMTDMATDMEKASGPDETLEILLAAILDAFSFGRGAVFWGDRRECRILNGSRHGDGAVVMTRTDVRGPVDGDAAYREARRTGRPLLLRKIDAGSDPLSERCFSNARNVVVLPVAGAGGREGYLLVEYGGRHEGQRLPRRTLMMLTQFASHAGLVMRNATLLAEREHMANIDGLTGLSNRREFDRRLGDQIRSAQERVRPLTLAVIDVDHFKEVNDELGHQAGDEVLRRLAKVMMSATRQVDTVARIGGEEFAIVLPDCAASEATSVLGRLQSELAADPGLEGITLSIGLATLPGAATNAKEFVAAADAAMYASKRAGRDRPDDCRGFRRRGR